MNALHPFWSTAVNVILIILFCLITFACMVIATLNGFGGIVG
jgi:hypothetical protein